MPLIVDVQVHVHVPRLCSGGRVKREALPSGVAGVGSCIPVSVLSEKKSVSGCLDRLFALRRCRLDGAVTKSVGGAAFVHSWSPMNKPSGHNVALAVAAVGQLAPGVDFVVATRSRLDAADSSSRRARARTGSR